MSNTQLNAANIRALEQIYVAAMLEELQLFNVMDRLVTLFQSGLLPIGSGASSEKLYKYWKQQGQRLSLKERRNLYSQALGIGGSDAGLTPNQEFEELWLRFISTVSSAAEQSTSSDLAERRIRQQAVRKAGRDLAANLSMHGFGFTHFAALDLQTQIKLISSVLSAPDVRSAYGARSMWEVVDRVASLELGGASNVVQYRTMAEAGSTIISWLARKARNLAKESIRPILSSQREDRRLVAACERWLLARTQPDDDDPSGGIG